MFETTKEARELDDMFHGEEKPLHPDTIHMTFRKPAVAVSKTENTTSNKVQKPIEEQWEPAKPAHNQFERLKAAAKSAILYAGLSLLFFYFQQSGQMAMTASMPCIVTCVALAGFGVGKSFAGGSR